MQNAELSSMAIPMPLLSDKVASRPDTMPVVRLEAKSGWRAMRLGELWESRELLFFLAWRDVKVRYKQTVFGAAWAVLQPALMMIAFSVFFWRLAGLNSGSIPYPLFVYAGLLPWTLFATAVNGAGNSVVASERLVTKIYFPRLLIPLASVGTAIVDFCMAMGLMAALMVYYHTWGGRQLLLAPVLMLVIVLTASGIGTFVAAMTVRYRDVKYVLPFMLQFWMFATPSIYLPTVQKPMGGLRLLLAANPMTGLISAFRGAILGGPIPWFAASISGILGLALFIFGCMYFQRVEDRFADEI
jgi:lipopolysaccharide transport system permease protein